MSIMKKIILLAFALFTLTACNLKQQPKQRTIMVSIEPLRYFTEQIAGDKFQVKSIVAKGASPEMYEPTGQQLMELSQSDLFIKVGRLGFEQTWLKKIEQNAPHTIIINASEGITPQKSIDGISDPHVWMSTVNAQQIAQNIYSALALIDAKDSLYFKDNLQNLTENIRMLDINMREQMGKELCSAFLIYHPTLTYFASEYGLTQIPIEEEGHEPSAKQLQAVIKMAKQRQVKSLLVQREFSNRNVSVIARETGAQILEINPLDYHWDQQMMHIAQKLR